MKLPNIFSTMFTKDGSKYGLTKGSDQSFFLVLPSLGFQVKDFPRVRDVSVVKSLTNDDYAILVLLKIGESNLADFAKEVDKLRRSGFFVRTYGYKDSHTVFEFRIPPKYESEILSIINGNKPESDEYIELICNFLPEKRDVILKELK